MTLRAPPAFVLKPPLGSDRSTSKPILADAAVRACKMAQEACGTNEELVAMHELTQKGQAAVTASNRNVKDDRITNHIKEAIKRAAKEIQSAVVPIDELIISNGKYSGIFLFHEDKRFAVAEIWLTNDGKVLEILRAFKEIKEIDAEYIYINIGTRTFVNGIAKAFDEIHKKKESIANENDEVAKKLKQIYGI